jgi:hypothetical protein
MVNCSLGSLCIEIFFFSIFFFGRVNYIFHKFSGNTKHIQFRLIWACGEVLFTTGFKFIFSKFSKELLYATMWLKLPKGLRVGAKKEVCFAHKILIFHFFSLLLLLMVLHGVTFNLWSMSEVFDFFQGILQAP